MESDDHELWKALVTAERSIAKIHAALRERDTRFDLLNAALGTDASSWDQFSAMNYLRSFRRDIPHFIVPLFGHALGGRWESLAREVLASGIRREVAPEVCRLALLHLPRPDPEDYFQVASLLASLEAGAALGSVATEALNSDDLDIREAGGFISVRYQHIISAGSG